MGSVVAVLHLAEALGLPARGYVGQAVPLPGYFSVIPRAREVEPLEPANHATWHAFTAAELFVVVDCGDLGRTGTGAGFLGERPERVILIDHHASNPGFGAVNWIEPEAESTTVLLHRLVRELGVPLSADLAACLYAGLVTDTGSFRWGTPRMHEVAAELLATGIDGRVLAESLMDNIDVDDIRGMGEVLATARVVDRTGVPFVWATVGHRQYARLSPTAVEGITDVIRAQREAPIGVLTKELAPGRWAISLRSRIYDVSRVAKRLGGGGHRAAAGATVIAEEPEVLARVVAAIDAATPAP